MHRHLRLKLAFLIDAIAIVAIPAASIYAAIGLPARLAWKANLTLQGVSALVLLLHAVLVQYVYGRRIFAAMAEIGVFTLCSVFVLDVISYAGISFGLFAQLRPVVVGSLLFQMLWLLSVHLMQFFFAQWLLPELRELERTGAIDIPGARL